ncbi:MAG: hypothetical protein ACW981_06275 [Candidatus Hodarchaeales archaeon]|jgi:hypothetical protein
MSSPPIKDLYEQLGKKIKSKEKEAEEKAEEKLTSFYDGQTKESNFFSPDIKNRFLQLQNSKFINVDKLEQKIIEKPRFFSKKEYFQSLALDLLSFGISWTRLEGNSLVFSEEIIDLFFESYPTWKDATYQDISQILLLLKESGLALGDNVDGFWFENKDDSKELRNVLLLADNKGMITKAIIKNKLKWNEKKINDILNIMLNQGIVIMDNENNDVFWILGEF